MGIQVTELTQGKNCHEKEFIDFEFDGKHVSEFGMVAVADGGRHSFDAAPTFEDETSQVNGIDGQYYWGTHFGSKKMSFTLATDGMTEAQVNAFKLHFKPGKYGKFIEDKLSSRYGYARISQVTTFNTVPFRVEKKIMGQTIYINEYKGDCRITFEFDDPYMKATMNLIEDFTENNELKLRAMYTNGTPYSASWNSNNNYVCFVGSNEKILTKGAVSPLTSGGLSNQSALTYYNPATSKTKAIIQMKFQPTFIADGETSVSFPVYFHEIRDDINNNTFPYNRILTTLSVDKDVVRTSCDYPKEFRYTTPNVIQQINHAIELAASFYAKSSTGPALDFEELLRLEIVDSKVMAWAAAVLRIIKTRDAFYNRSTGNFKSGTLSVNCSPIGAGTQGLNWWKYFNVYMLYMLANCADPEKFHLEGEAEGIWTFNPYTITFNGEENRTYMTYSYNRIINILEKVSVAEENCGDMILSEYLNLDGGDVLNDDGTIASCHHMKFIKGEDTTHTANWVSLVYTPTYF